jgi:predicted TIM-barrel fold metal-dependent hydrolase
MEKARGAAGRTGQAAELVVDADGHVCEPADLWETRLPRHLRERGIRLRWNEATGYDVAHCEDWIITDRGLAGLGNAGGNNVELGRGIHYQDLNPAGFDGKARLAVMDAEGIDLAVLYPGLGFSLGAIRDPELGIASCRVYNDWMAEYCAADPKRLVGTAALPMQDPKAAAAEARRAASELGLRGTFVRPNPHGERLLHDRVFDPVWEALEETGLPLGFHPAGLFDLPGTSRSMRQYMADGTPHAVILFFDQYMTLSNLVYAGVLERHPRLKVLILECGGGWIAHWMDRVDEFTKAYGWQLGQLKLTPSEYFLRQGYISFDPGERTMAAMTQFIGHERMVWASDFPHSDARYPGVVDELREHSEDLSPEARAGLLGKNALALYRIPDPRS